jgi:hypothetical protein
MKIILTKNINEKYTAMAGNTKLVFIPGIKGILHVNERKYGLEKNHYGIYQGLLKNTWVNVQFSQDDGTYTLTYE